MLYKKTQPKIKYDKFKEQDYLPFKHQGFATMAIHEGQEPEPIHGSVNVPIHMTSTYAQKDIAKPYGKFDYTRGGNPTRQALQKCIAALQYGKYCITFASGCGATATILHIFKTGDHIIVCDDVYGGTQRYMRLFLQNNFGFDIQFVDMTNVENVKKAIKKQTKMIWIQTPTNPTMKIIDIEAICKIAKQHKILTVADNTFATPYLQSPMLLGVDIVYNSCTKYLGGHSDVVMGAVVFNDHDLYQKVYVSAYSLGANPSPFDCYLMMRGIKTMQLRVIQSTKSAYHLAHYMEKLQLVESIIYPGLKSHPQHQIAKKQMRGFGGMISFRIKGGKQQVSKFLKATKIFILAQSLGGVDSLAQCPAFMTHASVPADKRAQLGITDNLIRLSIGCEQLDDIIADIDQAIKASSQ